MAYWNPEVQIMAHWTPEPSTILSCTAEYSFIEYATHCLPVSAYKTIEQPQFSLNTANQ